MKTVFMITLLPIYHFVDNNRDAKTAGNQTMYNTLKGYSENGFRVHVLSFCDSEKKRYEPFPNITIIRSWYVRLFKAMRKLKRCLMPGQGETPDKADGKIIRNFSLHSKVAPYSIMCMEGIVHALRYKPDIVYGYEIYTTRAARKIADRIRKPLVTRFQGTELSFFMNDEDTFWKAKNYIEGTRVPADLVIMTNDGTEGDIILRKLKMNPQTIRFWINGLHDKGKYLSYSRDAQFRDAMNIPEKAFILCVANRFIDWKRIDRIIRVVNSLRERNYEIFLLAIGSGPEDKTLHSLVNELGISGNVRFTGALGHEQVIYYIANSDMCITLNEGGNLGNSILEAMALGTPVCTIKNHSIQMLLSDRYNAILTESANVDDVAERISEAIDNPNLCKTLADNARITAQEKISSWPERMKLETQEVEKLIHQ